MASNKKSKSSSNNLGIILVTYGNEKVLPKLAKRLAAEKRSGDYIVLIDNHPDHFCAKISENLPGIDTIVRSANIGFAAGCNRGVRLMPDSIDLILLLNPDVMPEPGAIALLREGGRKEWSAWMGLLVMPDKTINSAGTVVHMSGLSWCNNYGDSIARLQPTNQVTALSGACLMIRKDSWEYLGGFNENYFMYYEDTDLSFCMLRHGLKYGVVTTAHFEHDYIFLKSRQKWFYLERNRYIFICRQWPLGLVLILLPYLVASEIALWAISILQGRVWLRIKAIASFALLLPTTISQRIQLQRNAKITSRQFIAYLEPKVETPLLSYIQRMRFLNAVFVIYYRFAVFVLRGK